jgi:acylphosphatase
MKKAIKVVINGIVQEVFFRAFLKEKADLLGIRGFVRNLENKDVEAYFEGDNEQIEKMMDFTRQGPPHSVIKRVDVIDEKYTGDYKGFNILRF